MSEDGGGRRHGGDGGAAHGGLPSRPSEDVEVRGKTKLDVRSKLQYKVNQLGHPKPVVGILLAPRWIFMA